MAGYDSESGSIKDLFLCLCVQRGQCCTGSCELPRMGAKSQVLLLCKISQSVTLTRSLLFSPANLLIPKPCFTLESEIPAMTVLHICYKALIMRVILELKHCLHYCLISSQTTRGI